jgi:hypothetical protein
VISCAVATLACIWVGISRRSSFSRLHRQWQETTDGGRNREEEEEENWLCHRQGLSYQKTNFANLFLAFHHCTVNPPCSSTLPLDSCPLTYKREFPLHRLISARQASLPRLWSIFGSIYMFPVWLRNDDDQYALWYKQKENVIYVNPAGGPTVLI